MGPGEGDQPADPRQPRERRATGYFDYFNGPGASDGPAGPRGKGYYSFDLGAWHLVALNSNCSSVSCSAGSEQERWLRADLAAHPTDCTLAYWHHPRFSSGHGGSNESMQPLWEALQDAQAELLLSGHSHDYERFAPLDRNGDVDRAGGIRQFVVGTGGAFFTGGLGTLAPHSEVAQNNTFGVLKLTLHPSSYDWQFVPEAGQTFTDSGIAAMPWPDRSAGAAVPRRPAPDRDGARDHEAPAPPPPDQARRASSGTELSEAAGGHVHDQAQVQGRLPTRRAIHAAGPAGANERRFRARIRTRRLRRGTFKAVLRAGDAAGNRSGTEELGFRVVRRRALTSHFARATFGGPDRQTKEGEAVGAAGSASQRRQRG